MSLLHIKNSKDLVTCPYDPSHRITALRYTNHLVKCAKNHPNKRDDFTTCPFNATHRVPIVEKAAHLASCPDKIVIERDVLRHQPSRPKASIMVPAYNNTNIPETTEDWDLDCDNVAAGSYLDEISRSRLNCNQNAQTMALMPPAEKKKVYKQMWSDQDASSSGAGNSSSEVDSNYGPTLQEVRMPKTTSMFGTISQNSCLGLGRGVPKSERPSATPITPSPIPAPIFGSQGSSVISVGFGRGIGRGRAKPVSFPMPGTGTMFNTSSSVASSTAMPVSFPMPGTSTMFNTSSSVASSIDLDRRNYSTEPELQWTTVGAKPPKKIGRGESYSTRPNRNY